MPVSVLILCPLLHEYSERTILEHRIQAPHPEMSFAVVNPYDLTEVVSGLGSKQTSIHTNVLILKQWSCMAGNLLVFKQQIEE